MLACRWLLCLQRDDAVCGGTQQLAPPLLPAPAALGPLLLLLLLLLVVVVVVVVVVLLLLLQLLLLLLLLLQGLCRLALAAALVVLPPLPAWPQPGPHGRG